MNCVTRSQNKTLIKNTVIPLWDDIVEDGTIKECFTIDTHKDCWLHCVIDGEFVGFFQASPFNRTVLDVHCYVKKDKRKYSDRCGIMAMRWLRDNAPEMYKTFITQTPSCNKHIKKYAEKLGFTMAGTYKNAFLQNGELHDLWLFSLDREAVK